MLEMTPFEIYQASEFILKRIQYDNEAENRRTARICCTLANIYRNKKKKKKSFTEDDFMPVKKKTRQEKQMSVKDLNCAVRMLTIMCGGKIVKAGE
jgi:uncharacterized membrane-anchored protein